MAQPRGFPPMLSLASHMHAFHVFVGWGISITYHKAQLPFQLRATSSSLSH